MFLVFNKRALLTWIIMNRVNWEWMWFADLRFIGIDLESKSFYLHGLLFTCSDSEWAYHLIFNMTCNSIGIVNTCDTWLFSFFGIDFYGFKTIIISYIGTFLLLIYYRKNFL